MKGLCARAAGRILRPTEEDKMRADIQKYNPKTIAKPLGLYSHVARAKATEYLHIAGQVSLDSAE
jgi:hypothetical protein